MMFFPYRVDLDLKRIPWITLLICAVCIWVFIQQLNSHERYVKAVNHFCEHSLARSTQLVLKRFDDTELQGQCAAIYLSIRDASEAETRLRELTDIANDPKIFKNPSEEKNYVYQKLKSSFDDFENLVPLNLTDEYSYNPLQVKVKQMFTSVFSHGSWAHLIFNLIFFYAFAASVEVITGSLIYGTIVLFMAVSTNLAYTLVSSDGALPTVGLSGVVMGMMALLAVAMPTLRIRCFLWIILYFRRLRVPALLLALWFIGWDIYNVQVDISSNTNYVAHISGAITGAAIGFIYWLTRADYLRDLAENS